MESTAPAAKSGGGSRLTQLDAMRALAAVSVMSYHYTHRFPQLYNPGVKPLFTNWNLDYIAISTFFMISGFVIFMTLERSARLRDFVLSRLLRLYPMYVLAIAITFTAMHIFGPENRAVGWKTVLRNLTLFQNWLGDGGRNVDGVYWTIGVEVNFYVLISLAFLFGWLRGRNLGITIGVWLALSYYLESHWGEWVPGSMYWTRGFDTWWSQCFISGICCYLVYKNNGRYTKWTAAGHLGSIALVLALRNVPMAILLASLILIMNLASTRRVPVLSSSILAKLGVCTYALYLLHQNLGYTLMLHLQPHTGYWFALGCAYTMAIGLALAGTHLWEEPVRASLKKKLKATAFFRPLPTAPRPRSESAAVTPEGVPSND
jgi:peptidoglycan/LPS O-acetylase OafA/YrhL